MTMNSVLQEMSAAILKERAACASAICARCRNGDEKYQKPVTGEWIHSDISDSEVLSVASFPPCPAGAIWDRDTVSVRVIKFMPLQVFVDESRKITCEILVIENGEVTALWATTGSGGSGITATSASKLTNSLKGYVIIDENDLESLPAHL